MNDNPCILFIKIILFMIEKAKLADKWKKKLNATNNPMIL